jgi:hypothetical protein
MTALSPSGSRGRQGGVTDPSSRSPRRRATKPTVGQTVEMVKAYAKQETLGPLRGAGRWLAFGTAASLLFGLGIFLVVLGILRLLQTELPDTFDGTWSWVPYLVALIVCLAAVALAISRIKKTSLSKEPR